MCRKVAGTEQAAKVTSGKDYSTQSARIFICANPNSLAKRDARGFEKFYLILVRGIVYGERVENEWSEPNHPGRDDI